MTAQRDLDKAWPVIAAHLEKVLFPLLDALRHVL